MMTPGDHSSVTTERAAGLDPAVCHLLQPIGDMCAIVRTSCLSLAITLAAVLGSPAASAADLIIGVAGPMSGPLAVAGQQYTAAAMHVAEQFNKQGGLNGASVKIITADDKATPKMAVTAARWLAAKKAAIVIGHYNSTPALAARDIYLENNILVVAPQAIISKLTDLKAWNIIRLGPRADTQANAAADFLASTSKSPKIALVHDGSAFSRVLIDKASILLTQRGIKPALAGEIPPGSRHTISFTSKLARRIARSRINAVYWTGSSAGAASLLAALRKRKSSAVLIGTDVLASPSFAKTKNPDALVGARMTLPLEITGTPLTNDVIQELKLEQSGEETAPAVAAYTAMQLIGDAAKATKTNDPRRLAQYLRSGKTFETIIGPVSFDAKGDRREKLYKIYRWVKAADGKLLFVPDTSSQ